MYNENNIPQYFLNINIIKVFPIIDFNFYSYIEEKKLSQIKFVNPFKYDLMKTQNLLNTHHFLNSIDKNSDINLKLDPLNNDFYFEAMLIVYAMIEDRLRSFLYYIGALHKADDLRLNVNQTKAILRRLYFGSDEAAFGQKWI